MHQALETLCVYTCHTAHCHQFNFVSADYEAVNYFSQILAHIEQTNGWYNAPCQQLIIDASRTSYIPLRYLFESVERFHRQHHHGRTMPQLQWAILQPELFQLHQVAQLYLERSPHPVQVRFFPPFVPEEALNWLGHSNSG